MPWVNVFLVFIVSHMVGDYVVQTDWQATHKHGGLGSDPVRRQALLTHVATYTLAFVPALIWLTDDLGVAVLAVAAGISLPHLVQDDGRLLVRYVRRVKGCDDSTVPLIIGAVDQSFHVVALFVLALIAGS